MTEVTWNRPSSNTRAENPVLWCDPRIFTTRIRRLDPEERRVRPGLRQDDRRRAEVPEPFEQPEQVRTSVLELREDLEGLERVDHDEVDAFDVFLRLQRAAEEFHPGFRRALPGFLLDRAEVEDVHFAADGLDVEAHRRHLRLEALPRLFEGDVEA